jgi:Na+:H+ antiporter, NhaA family
MSKPLSAPASHLPVAPVRRLVRPLVRFLQIESASGLVLLACAVLALVLANSSFADDLHAFWHTPIRLQIGTFLIGGELGHFVVNDVLMTIFFFVVGLEIKRELVAGELRDPRKAALPVIAALGGMVVPAGIFVALQAGQPGFRGWGIPMATDIAFVVGAMAILGPRVPFGLKIMILSLAIADDIGAVVVIAIFYSTGLNWAALGLAALGFGLTYLLNHIGVRALSVYVIVGVAVWFAFHHSGVHPTMTGVVLGLLTPTREWVGPEALRLSVVDLAARLEEDGTAEPAEYALIAFAAKESISPLERLETGLHPWVGFIIMPLFALANAGVHVEAGELTHPVALAVALGLFLGKPIGVVLFSYLAVWFGIAKLPRGVNWWVLLGGGCLAGIGFTMSLFVAGLALSGDERLLAAGKIGTLIGSVCSAIGGTVVLVVVLRGREKQNHEPEA